MGSNLAIIKRVRKSRIHPHTTTKQRKETNKGKNNVNNRKYKSRKKQQNIKGKEKERKNTDTICTIAETRGTSGF